MKKVIISTLAMAGLTISGYSQGIVTFDTTETTSGSQGYVSIAGVTDTATDINAAMLYFNGTSYVPAVTFLLGYSGDVGATVVVAPGVTTEAADSNITAEGNGQLLDVNGNNYQFTPGHNSGTTISVEIAGWTGNAGSYAASLLDHTAYIGTTSPFTVTLTDTGSPILANIANMPNLNLVLNAVPEPATFAMMGLGALSLVLFRRK